MARDLEVEARLTLKDDLSKKAGTALDAVSKKARNAGKAADALAATKKDAGAQAYERTAQAAHSCRRMRAVLAYSGVSSSAFSVSSSVASRISKSRWNALLFSSHNPIANWPLIVSMCYSSFLSCANILMSRLASFSVSYCSPTSVTTHPV